MYKENFGYTKDYKDIIQYSAVIANSQQSPVINADELLLGVYIYLQKFDFNNFFWKYIGIKDLEILEIFFNDNYNEDIKISIKKTKSLHIDLDKYLKDQFSFFNQFGLKKLDFLALLHLAFTNLSSEIQKYFKENSIDLSKIETKISYLLSNKNISKIGAVNLFKILSQAMTNMDIDDKNIEMIINIEGMDTSYNGGPDQEMVENGNNPDTHINSDIKKEEKKLTIEYFGTDLTYESQKGFLDPIIGRQKEIDQVTYTLMRKTKNNPLLIGEAGVGKTAIVEGLAQKIVQGAVPDKLKNKRLFVLDMGSLLAGTKYRGEFEARLKSILEEATDPANNIILFIDEIHTIIGAGNAEGSTDAAHMLKPLLSRGKLQLIGATTFDEYQKHIEKDPALKRRFQEVVVEEPNRTESIEILEGLKERYDDFHGVLISQDAILTCIDLSSRYIMNKYLPDKALDLLDEACARKSTLNEKLKNNDDYKKTEHQLAKIHEKIEKSINDQDYFAAAELKEKEEVLKENLVNLRNQNVLPKNLRPAVQTDDIGQVLADKLGVPVNNINISETQKLKDLDALLSSKVLGQEEAVESVVKAMKRNRLSMIQRNKPISSFLFLGPSGVGKTYLAKTLAQEYFGDPKSLIRVDMSEFMEKFSASKLIGSAPGYVGYDEGGILTEAVRRRPYSVVLFDEIEKASPEVLNILLQVMDEGFLKDNKGRWIDFKNTVIILTSNIGSEEFGKKIPRIGFETAQETKLTENYYETVKEKVMEQLKDQLSPELLNRLDKIVVFKPLNKDVLGSIFKDKYLEFVNQRKQKDGISIVKYNNKQVSEIVEKIYEPQYGARPVERYIYEEIEPKLIEQVLENE